MVAKQKSSQPGRQPTTNIKADVIILGCSLPGIVTAHKLKKKFGKSMDIVVLDLARSAKAPSRGNVNFEQQFSIEADEGETVDSEIATQQIIDNIAKHFLSTFAKEFSIPLPDAILNPNLERSPLIKLFQYKNGSTVESNKEYHDFDYLNILERFELNQYQDQLDQNARDLFQMNRAYSSADRQNLLCYDQTTMEQHICSSLFFSTSREIMRTTVRLVCGAPAHVVSVLFYLHQCRRTCSARNHLDGSNTRFREKLLGYCRKQVANKLQHSISDITVTAKPIQKIRSYTDEQVILETMKGDSNYVCNLLAMAIRPDELLKIAVEEKLLSESDAMISRSMTPGKAKKFLIQYEENFWQKKGYSGDILSIRGPIVWAMQRPELSTTGAIEKYSALVGYLVAKDDRRSSKDAVLEQLTKLFGEDAATPVSYKETDISDIYIPRCGDYIALLKLTGRVSNVEWGAMDLFADGDVASALEAGHNTYLHLLTSLRPQSQSFEDLTAAGWPTVLDQDPVTRWMSHVNFITSAQIAAYAAIVYFGIRFIRSYLRK